MARTAWIFCLLVPFTATGFASARFGYYFFNATTARGVHWFGFLLFGGITVFLGGLLIRAFTHGPPAFWTALLPPPQNPVVQRMKVPFFVFYTAAYAVFVVSLTGGIRLEEFVVPIAYGILAVLLFSWFLRVIILIFGSWQGIKKRK